MSERAWPENPFCECGQCDATGREGSSEIMLPISAWAVAGEGDLKRVAVHPDHVAFFENDGVPVEHFDGWAAIG